jgi:acyl-homoserine-lactone acylase
MMSVVCVAATMAAERVEVLRDEFGVPHIFAQTEEGAAFASGYVQAEDRISELMNNFRKAEGTMAEAYGEEWYAHDQRQRFWGHARVAYQNYHRLSPKVRRIVEAFTAGIAKWMAENPAKVPAHAVKPEPWRVVALSRYTIWSWPTGEMNDDLKRAGLKPEPVPYRGSNEMLLAPSRTKSKAVLAVVDPHLSWYGETRYYEMRIYGGELAYSGGCRLGLPHPTLGHSRFVSIAMTTGGPDTSDVFEEKILEDKYLFKGQWLPLDVHVERIGVRVGSKVEWRPMTIRSTHHGPLWTVVDSKGYAMATPYADQVWLLDQAYAMVTAKNLDEMKRALSQRQYMAQNIMVGTVQGDIYYVRNGRVPVRAAGCDPSKPMPGWTGECEWAGLHPLEDLVQVANPPQGYMQNNNLSPFAMMKNSPMVAEKYRAYLYNAGNVPAHQRGAATLEDLDGAKQVTLEQMVGFAFQTRIHKAELWQQRIRAAGGKGTAAKAILTWNRRSDPDSRGALAFYLFKKELGEFARDVEPKASLTGEQVRQALARADERLHKEFAPDATYGTYFRAGREGSPRNFPVGGGGLLDAGMATPRNITFVARGNIMMGVGGQTQTQIIELTQPPRSYMIIPLGNSDDPQSPHFDDQVEKLFSQGKAKDTFFLRRSDLEKHVTSRKELTF